ncbi:MAG: glycosyltransferase family 2 protein [Candidatus Sumerlaeaceae bacterium]
MTDPPVVTMVIVNYETSTYLRRCVDSLRNQSQPQEIIIVDNASPMEDWRNLQLEGTQLIRSEQNIGYGMACNRGAAEASDASSFICILNPDTLLRAGMLEHWVERYRQLLPNGGILAPVLVNENGGVQRSSYNFPGFASYWVNHSMMAGLLKHWKKTRAATMPRSNTTLRDYHRVDWVMGAALLLDRETWRALGGFAPSYFLYAEDTDLCFRSWELGKPVLYDHIVEVTHTQGDPVAETRHLAMIQLFVGMKTFLRQHYPRWRRAGVTIAITLDMILRIIALGAALLFKPGSILLRNRLRGSWQVLNMFVRSG